MTDVLCVGTEAVAGVLAEAGLDVERAADLEAALDVYGVDCLVVDAEALAGSPEGTLSDRPDLPVVVVGDGDDAAAVLDDGATDYVLRAAPDAVLVDRVESAAERTRDRRRFDAVFEDAPRPMGIFDTDGFPIRRNATARTFDPDGSGDRFWERVWVERSPMDTDAVRAAFEGAAAGEPQRIPGEVTDSEGRTRSMLVELRPVRTGETVTAVVAETIPADDDAMPGSDTAVTPVSRQLRTVVDNLPIVVFAFDTDGTITLSEGKGLEAIGLDPADLVGEDTFEVFGDNEAVVNACRRALDGEEVNTVVTVDDSAFETWYRPISEDGEVEQVLGAAIDVTGLKERERELEQYETIIETVPDGVFVIDEEGTIVQGNTTAAEMMGYEGDELVGEPFFRLVEDGVVDASLVEDYREIVRDLLSSGTDTEQARFEYPIERLDGERRIVESHVALRPHDEEFRGTIGVNRDVTERKRTERELRRQNERLENLASVVSHDLRNPLNVAQGLADLLAADHDDERLGDLRESLDRMQELIDELLELARTGKSVTDPEHAPVAELAREAWSTVSAPASELELDVDYAADVDRSRVRQLFENLFRNSMEHAETDGVTVTVGDLDDDPGFYVADDGPGIPEDAREQVFEYGFSTAEDGTGLGLAIVREIAEAHGWTVVVVESEEGGARFEFRESLEAERPPGGG